VCDLHKYMLLQRALMGSHLHSSLNTFNQQTITSGTQSSSSSSTSTNTSPFSTLNSILLQVDARMTSSERKSSDSQIRLDNRKQKEHCKMCVMAKTQLMINSIKYHPENTSCPQKNIELISTLVKPAKSAVVDSTKTTSGKYVPMPLPIGFDVERECANCWRSGQAQGINAHIRAAEHTLHSTRNCKYARAKRENPSYKPTYQSNSSHHDSSPRITYGDSKRNYNHDLDDWDRRPHRDEHYKQNYRSGGQSSASSVTSSIRSQETEVYSGRDRTSRQPHNYENYRDNRSRSRDRDSRDRRDRDYRHNH
jgi:hypothetical protein